MTSGSYDEAATVRLTTTSFVVLGLVHHRRSATAYELKAFADDSIGYFWDFPRSQIYAESTRLVRLGLLDEDQEPSGRRRRMLSLTEPGAAALRAWVATPFDDVAEIRDRGLLQLFFASAVVADDVVTLAEHQLRAHRRRLANYERIAAMFRPGDGDDPTRVVLEAGLRYERMSVGFWSEIIRRPPTSATEPLPIRMDLQ
ncbi:MAG: PadR family transcriptional regulator [Actinomycetota bacterium]|nr:PadR family transcriptional regulator [Actinomycetota bacterium]